MQDLIFKAVVKPSHYFAVLLLFLHVGCACIVALLNIPWVAKMVLLGLSLASLAYFWLRDVNLYLPFSWREISLHDNAVTVRMQNGSQRIGALSSKSIALSKIVMLRVTFEGDYLSASRVIFRDSFDSEQFRRMRVLLLMASAMPAPSSPTSVLLRHQ
ncbi:MAG: protein YgfX [Gallionella sp.]|nr:hypothetical protein [Gallionella sp.]